jgi:integrase
VTIAVDILQTGPDRYRLKIRVSGRKNRYATVHGTRAEAEIAAANLATEVTARGLAPVSPATPLGGWVRQFVAQQHHWSARSRAHYERLVDLLIDPAPVTTARARRAYGDVDPDFTLGRRALNSIMPADCWAWQSAMIDGRGRGKTSAMSAGALHLASRACVEAVKLRIIATNPFADVRIAEPRRRPIKIPETESLDRIVAAAARPHDDRHPEPEWRAARLGKLLHLALASGARRGELLALRWADVDHLEGSLRIRATLEETPDGLRLKPPKTESGNRDVPIAGDVLDALRAWRADAASTALQAKLRLADLPVLPDRDRVSWWEPATAGTLARRALHAAGIKVSLHSLRHSFATELLRARHPVAVVSEMLGHARPEITFKHYQHAMRGDGRAAAVARAEQIRGQG